MVRQIKVAPRPRLLMIVLLRVSDTCRILLAQGIQNSSALDSPCCCLVLGWLVWAVDRVWMSIIQAGSPYTFLEHTNTQLPVAVLTFSDIKSYCNSSLMTKKRNKESMVPDVRSDERCVSLMSLSSVTKNLFTKV